MSIGVRHSTPPKKPIFSPWNIASNVGLPPWPKSISRVQKLSAIEQNGLVTPPTLASRPQPMPPVRVKSLATVLVATRYSAE